MKKKSIIISDRSHKEIKKLTESFGSTIGGLVESMITYFKRTGINPKNAINENPSTMVKTLDKRIVSFLKVQERDILKPLKDEVYLSSKNNQDRLSELTENLNVLLNKMNTADKERTQLVKAELLKQQNGLLEIASFLDTKNKTGINERIKEIFR